MDCRKHDPTTAGDEEEDYFPLKDLRVIPQQEGKGFSFCLWIYLLSSSRASGTIIRQIRVGEGTGDGAPFLVLNDDKTLSLFPVLSLHEEAERIANASSVAETGLPCALARVEFLLGKWVHIGCEVDTDCVRLHVDGVLVGEKPLSYTSKIDCKESSLQYVTLAGCDEGDDKLQGFVHHFQDLRLSLSVGDHRVENPPLVLSVDTSSISENQDVEEGGDGVWSVVGGKASCRRNFSLDVVLANALGHSVNKEIEIVASLVYADNGAPVEKRKDDSEAPLLISYDGVEFPSTDRPVKLINDIASFKLKISQLSSKCDNRLFRIRFNSLKDQMQPFLEAYSRPIRCISRNRTIKPPSVVGRKHAYAATLFCGPPLSRGNEGTRDIQTDRLIGTVCTTNQESKHGCTLKRVKIGHDRASTRIYANTIVGCLDEGCPMATDMDEKIGKFEGTGNTPSDSESVHARKSTLKEAATVQTPIPDMMIFKYCLEGLPERTVLLKDVAASATDSDLVDFAQQVSLYTGCSHHRNQILVARELVQEGEEIWSSLHQNAHQVFWKNSSQEIERRFVKIARCSSRRLSVEDLELLHRMAGSSDCISREEFDRMWNWLYPVAYALSRDEINAIWECTSPKWIEGLITKEEAESSLIGPRGLQAPGTFVLRFPTSRSWPHPDAGSMVVTYVGADCTIHHKLLSSLGYSEKGCANQTSLQELLLSEPDLSQLGRVTRQRHSLS